MSGDRLARIWTQIAQQSLGAPVTVAHACAATVAGVGVDGAGVTVIVSPTVSEVMNATDRVATGLEELQLTLGQGPCVDTFSEGGPVIALDLRSAEFLARWPAFTPAALDLGARALFALPLHVGAIRLGVMDLYRAQAGGLSESQLADALVFADTVGMLLLDIAADPRQESSRQGPQHPDPVSHHAVVHQATGMVLVQLGSSADTAFARLRAYSFSHDRRLSDVARDVVERRLRFAPDPDTS